MKFKQKKGISLIVLVITIIVMIILAAAIILSLNGSGIIGKANKAKTSTDYANAKNSVVVSLSEWKLDGKTGSFSEYAEDKLHNEGFRVTSKLGNGQDKTGSYEVTDDGRVYVYPKIPAGFVASNKDTEDQVSEGLVIYEGIESVKDDTDALTTRNQFVWIPVPDINQFVRRDGYVSGELQILVSSGKVLEPYTYDDRITKENDITGEHAEYAAMYESVQKYGGFYIGRYETGTTAVRSKETDNGTNLKSDGVTPDLAIQKDKEIYTWVCWGPTSLSVEDDVVDRYGYNQGMGAVTLSRGVYPKSANYDVVSTLVYGVQWDAMLSYISDTVDINDSRAWGNVADKFVTTAYYKVQPAGSMEEWKAKNMYDIAGNAEEWTMEWEREYSASMNGERVQRGGRYSWYGGGARGIYASSRTSANEKYTTDCYGFRIALYLK